MRLSRILASANWKYAVGEIFLIVIGVTLALMVNSWYESWQERRYEMFSLQQIETALQADLADFTENFRALQQAERELSELLKALRAGDSFGPEIESYLDAVTMWRGGVGVRLAPYEELKNQGFSLISNDSLRLKLVDVYESKFPGVQGPTQLDLEFSTERVQPYFYERFRRSDGGEWAPIDNFDLLRTDPYLENLVTMKLSRLQRRLLPGYDELTTAIQDVLAEIDAELSLDPQ